MAAYTCSRPKVKTPADQRMFRISPPDADLWIQLDRSGEASIAYDVYLNGVRNHTTGGDRAISYATRGGENMFTVIAVDDAGNRSAPASIVIQSIAPLESTQTLSHSYEDVSTE